MNRRDFIAAGLASGASALAASDALSEGVTLANAIKAAPVRKFKLNYAPHFGMFRNHTGADLVAQLQFFHGQGFTALEDNSLPSRSIADQEQIGKTLADLKMTMGVFVATKDFDRRNERNRRKKTQHRISVCSVHSVCSVIPSSSNLK